MRCYQYKKTMLSNKKETLFLFLLLFGIILFLLFYSCKQSPDNETMRRYALASESYSNGKLNETKEILQKESKFPPSLMLKIKAEYYTDDLSSAQKSIKKIMKLQPSSFEAKLYNARILRENNNLPGAIKTVENLLSDNPYDIRTLRLAAELALDNDKYDEAAGFLDRAAELSVESAIVLLDRARLKWTLKKYQEALDDLKRAKAMLPWDTPLYRSIENLEKIIKEAMQ